MNIFENEILIKNSIFIAIFLFVFIAFIFVKHGCYASGNSKNVTPKDRISFTGNWDENKAIKIVYNICKGWQFDEFREGYSIKSSLSFQRNNIAKRFIQISANSESCRFCPGLIGAVVFSERNSKWKVEFEDENFARFGCNGVPPEAKMIKIGSDRYGLLFQWWRSGQGGGYVHYVALIDLGGKDYPLILNEIIHMPYDALVPSIPKLETYSNTEGEFYNIKIGPKLFYFKTNKYKAFSKQPIK